MHDLIANGMHVLDFFSVSNYISACLRVESVQ